MEFHAVNLTKFEYSIWAILGESMKLKEASMTLSEYRDTLEHVFTELPRTLACMETLFVSTFKETQTIVFHIPVEVPSSSKTGDDCKVFWETQDSEMEFFFSGSSGRGSFSAKT